jgi:signal transduction histidine kinase
MRNPWERYLKMRLKNKLILVNGIIIAIFTLTATVAVFLVSNYTLTTNSVAASRNLLDQMGSNLEYILSAVEEAVFVQVIHSDLQYHLRRSSMPREPGRTVAALRSTSNFAYNLIGYNRGFLSVAVADMQGNIYGYAASRLKHITEEEALRNMAFERALGLWGKAFWHTGPDGLLYVDRAVFDMASMEMMGVVSVGVDPGLLWKRLQGIPDGGAGGLVVLNADGQILLGSNPAGGGPAVRELPPDPEQGGMPVYYRGRAYTLAQWRSAMGKFFILRFIDRGLLARQSIRILAPLVYSALMAGMIALIIAMLTSKGISQGVENLELKALRFEYDSLLARINPHFLYNTLEGINSLAKISGQRRISEGICLLGNYLRQTVNTGGHYIRLSRELANLEDYIKILRLSFPWPIRLEADIDEALEETVVPKLILQPLVENAVIHGLARKKQGGCIRFSACCAGKDMLIRIQDNGEGMAGAGGGDDGSPRIGMSTVHKRLRILYGEQYGLQAENLAGKGVLVTLRLPILFEDEIAGRTVTEAAYGG